MTSLNSVSSPICIGVDVGGTKVAVLVAKHGQEMAHAVRPTLLDTPGNTLVGIADTIREAVSLAEIQLTDISAVGVGFPGRVDPFRGTVQLAVNLNLKDMAIGPLLEQLLGIPCFLENDVRMAALGLKYHPSFSQVQNLAYLSIGTGIAAGIILNGELYRGFHGMAGEIGHIQVVADGPRCQCGAFGCLEAVAAGPAIENRMAQVQQNTNLNAKEPNSLIRAGEIFQMAEHGHPIAKEIATQVGKYLGWAAKMLILSYDIELIVFGGGVSRAGNVFLTPLFQDITRQQQESDFVREMLKPEMIQLLPSDFNAPLWGGIVLAENGLMRERAGVHK